MLLGLTNIFTNDTQICEQFMTHLYGTEANIGEAAGYCLGLVKATHFDESMIDNLINSSRNNQHDRISRGMMCAVGLMALNNKQKVMPFFHKMIQERDH